MVLTPTLFRSGGALGFYYKVGPGSGRVLCGCIYIFMVLCVRENTISFKLVRSRGIGTLNMDIIGKRLLDPDLPPQLLADT